MAVPTKVVFPVPPPTTNYLTTQQRTQLMRSTKKLGRILGSTPHLIDTTNSNTPEPMHIHLPFDIMERYTFPRRSMDSISSGSSSTSINSSTRSLSRASSYSSSTQSISSNSSRSGSIRSKKSSASSDSSESWPSRKPPMLRLSLAPTLETIPASPLSGLTPPVYTHTRSKSVDGYEDPRFVICPSKSSPPSVSPTFPSFTIPSAGSERRQKMDRLRRKLGEGVPLDLVFPTDAASSPAKVEKELPPTPTLTPRAPKSQGRISSTRDSIASISPHHARRKIVAPKASRPAPPPPTPTEVRHRREAKNQVKVVHHPYSAMAQRDMNEKLCVIIESPDEHGSGCSEEFGFSSSPPDSPNSLESGWYSSDELALNSWNTRKGYKGWEDYLFDSLEPKRLPSQDFSSTL